MATVASCPGCGLDLDRLERVEIGDLVITDDARTIHWKGTLVELTPPERLIVNALARSPNCAFSNTALANVTGYEGDDFQGIVSVWICRLRRIFKAIDPGFDRIVTARCRGYFWRADELRGEHHGHR